MLIRVKSTTTPECWYSEMIGQKFIGFVNPVNQLIYFSSRFFFFPEDIETIQDHSGIINSGTFEQHIQIA